MSLFRFPAVASTCLRTAWRRRIEASISFTVVFPFRPADLIRAGETERASRGASIPRAELRIFDTTTGMEIHRHTAVHHGRDGARFACLGKKSMAIERSPLSATKRSPGSQRAGVRRNTGKKADRHRLCGRPRWQRLRRYAS